MTQPVRRSDAARVRSPWERRFSRLGDRMGDYPLASLALVSLLVLWLFGASMWLIVPWELALIALMFVLRERTKGRRARRRIARAWRGTPEQAGHAANLGFVNASGQTPKITAYSKSEDGVSRIVMFALPTGVTAETMAGKTLEMVDMFGAIRGEVEKVAPQTVRLTLVDVDMISEAQDAHWLEAVDPAATPVEDPSVGLGDELPWWEAENQAEGER